MFNLLVVSLLFLSYPTNVFSGDEIYRGILSLDDITFDRVVSKFHYALVKFDHPYPYGLDHNAFVGLGKQLAQLADVDIAVVNLEVKDYEEMDSLELAQRYGVDKNDFPALRLFVNHEYRNMSMEQFRKLQPIVYPTERDYNLNSQIVLNPITMRLFLWTQINVRTPLPNCTQQLDDLAEEFVYLLEQDKKGSELDKIQSQVDEIYTNTKDAEKRSASIYAKFMKKSAEKGAPFFAYEHRRIKNLLRDHQVPEDRKKKLRVHFNILQSFRLRHYERMLKENESSRQRNLTPIRIEL